MQEKRTKVTIDDVAKKAGVAKSTVSRIINNAPGVKPVTKLKVNRIIQELGFTPNLMARSLKTKLRRQIALAIDDIRNPYYPELAWAAEQVAKQNDYRLVLINHYGNPSEELAVIKEANDMHVDGIVLLSISHPKTLPSAVKQSSIPVSLIGSYGEDIQADTVGLSRSEGYLAMEHLIRIGRRRIAYAGGPSTLHRGGRYAAYEKSLASHAIPLDSSLVFTGERLALETGIEAARYFCKLEELPDAVFAANDLVAIGLLQEFTEQGVRVPEDIAVLGIDNIPWCTLVRPQLTSVSNLVTEMGRIAVEMLLNRIDREVELPFQKVLLEPRLIVRESTVKQN
ncbi:LacI family DNA-binding transcriptional regulator [Paenibacillus sp. GD4]|uniref:LacI family DNA-binding transcriptional regulator n=1 Tax=Paenibacillus sp. GD4 TaxID=3068890 RepID=UPI002796DFD5|nr:LacI family DNA-binding transcriptional regulator [Paenibacillus sp. GD4]MDQ1909016.1 LacI family DNA-binding transcriptional regulator [Paenibacillus sp. GD4]